MWGLSRCQDYFQYLQISMHGVIIYLFISNLSLELVLCLAIKEDYFIYNLAYFVRNFVKI
jgi:hypothetical protein